MDFCCCANLLDRDFLKTLSDIGFKYIEPNLQAYLTLSEDEAKDAKKYADSLGLSSVSFNCMFPGEIRLIGSEYSKEKLTAYLDKALYYASIAGTPLVTLGSGTTRSIPEGVEKEDAKKQFCAVLSDVIAPAAKNYGLKIGIEPLRACECNFLNSCTEIMEIVNAVKLPEINLTVDFFHAFLCGESYEAMSACGDRIVHVHLASVKNNRSYPTTCDTDDLADFFAAMKRAGYDGKLSIEGNIGEDRYASAKLAYDTMNAALTRI